MQILIRSTFQRNHRDIQETINRTLLVLVRRADERQYPETSQRHLQEEPPLSDRRQAAVSCPKTRLPAPRPPRQPSAALGHRARGSRRCTPRCAEKSDATLAIEEHLVVAPRQVHHHRRRSSTVDLPQEVECLRGAWYNTCSTSSLALVVCRRGAPFRSNLCLLWWSCSARAIAIDNSSYRSHERSRHSRRLLADVTSLTKAAQGTLGIKACW